MWYGICRYVPNPASELSAAKILAGWVMNFFVPPPLSRVRGVFILYCENDEGVVPSHIFITKHF